MYSSSEETPYVYSCFGLLIRSELALPEIAIAAGGAGDGALPCIEIRLAPLPAVLPGAQPARHGIQVGDGEVLLNIKDTARFLVRGGMRIIVDPAPGSSERNVRLFLLGSAFGILCHQRGLLPLHANAIAVNGIAIAYAGHTGAGKSTLAAYFQRAGYEVLCDDVCVISASPDGPLAWPGLPRLKLWRDAAASFGHDSNGLERAIDGQEKYHVPFGRAPGQAARPFRRLYVLTRSGPQAPDRITRLRGMAAVEAILLQTYRSNYLGPMGLRQRHFTQSAALLNHVEVYSASRNWGYDVFAQEAEKLERHLLDAGPV